MEWIKLTHNDIQLVIDILEDLKHDNDLSEDEEILYHKMKQIRLAQKSKLGKGGKL